MKVDEKIGTLLIGASGPDCRAALIKAQAEDLLCDLFGQRATFANYTDPTKLYSRRMLPKKVVRKTGLSNVIRMMEIANGDREIAPNTNPWNKPSRCAEKPHLANAFMTNSRLSKSQPCSFRSSRPPGWKQRKVMNTQTRRAVHNSDDDDSDGGLRGGLEGQTRPIPV